MIVFAANFLFLADMSELISHQKYKIAFENKSRAFYTPQKFNHTCQEEKIANITICS